MIPLAEQSRPQTLDDIVGQSHLIGKDGWIRKVIQSGKPLSILLWGPPGCGKTTLAKLYAKAFDAECISFSPLFQGVADLKKIISDFDSLPLFRKKLVIFADEIHRFNKAQQDAFLPLIESGKIILVGATTENPSFSLNNALLSRMRVLILNPLTDEDLMTLIERYIAKGNPLPLTQDAQKTLISWSGGDGRYLFNMLESLKLAPSTPLLEPNDLAHFVQRKSPLYDKADDGHYNLISALHKAVRGSDPDAALYWLCRMLNGGEDPQFLARRIIRMAVEDIGLADPNALTVAMNAWNTFDHLGSPEGDLALAEAIVYLALAPKSNAIYTAFKKAKTEAQNSSHLSPPKIILNAPSKLMKEAGFGKGYVYDHDTKECFSGQNYFPDGMDRPTFYNPQERGFERDLKKRLDYFSNLRQQANSLHSSHPTDL
jgi:putative ATPase